MAVFHRIDRTEYELFSLLKFYHELAFIFLLKSLLGWMVVVVVSDWCFHWLCFKVRKNSAFQKRLA
jgi:hypothetical protein